jgi:ribosomal protein L22(archaeal)/L17(eukaryotic/archaeal)
MVKEFLYRGIPKEELDSLSLEKLFLLFNSRQRRSLTRGITDGKRKLIEEIKSAKAGKLKNPIKTHLRDLIILPYMVGVTVNTFSGKEFRPVVITTEMVGHYLGEYVITNKKVSHGAPRCRRIKIQPLRTIKVIIMGRFNYAFQNYDPTRHVRSSLREKDISHKHAREVAVSIKGLSIEKARDYLIAVIAKKRAVPFRRYKNQVAHRADPGVMSGRYPQKTAKEFIKVLDNLESNAEYKGMDLDRLRIVNATVHKGVIVKRFTPRAMGRATPKNNVLTHVELVAKEI